MYLLVFLLAIASIATAQTEWKTITLPFTQSTDVNAVLVLDSSFIAFGDHQAIDVKFGSLETKTVDYDAEYVSWGFEARITRKAYQANNCLFAIGEEGLSASSSDNGKTWRDKLESIGGGQGQRIDAILSDSTYWYILYRGDRNVARVNRETNIRDGNITLRYEYAEPLPQGLETRMTGFLSGQNGTITYGSRKDTRGSRSSWFWFNGDIGLIKERLISPGDSLISSLAINGNADMLAINSDGSYSCYKTDGKDLIERTALTNAHSGDKLFPDGYINGNEGYFVGTDKDDNPIRIGLSGSRENLNTTITTTCLAGHGDTLIIGGKNGQVSIPESLATALHATKAEISFSLVKTGGSLFIRTDNENVKWKVISTLGKIITVGQGQEINGNFSPGVYLVEISDGTKKGFQKIIF